MMNHTAMGTQTTTDARAICPTRSYRVPEIARVLDVGPRAIYRAVREKKLRAAPMNDRGDLRILGAWALDYLELIAE